MNQFTRHEGLTVPLFQSNIDTDQIIPKQFLTRIERSGYGAFLFNDWRFEPDGTPKADFVLNDPKYSGASILVAGPNFGCGSSREHAAWSLMDFGFRAVIAPAFGDIFYNNSFKNGLLPVRLDEGIVVTIVERSQNIDGYEVTIDLEDQTVADSQGLSERFEIDAFRKHCLLNGLDDIGLTLQNEESITRYEDATKIAQRFAFAQR
jgi:3-isopropylmalate/(R)-2-methylmalate dehydratase small subunit